MPGPNSAGFLPTRELARNAGETRRLAELARWIALSVWLVPGSPATAADWLYTGPMFGDPPKQNSAPLLVGIRTISAGSDDGFAIQSDGRVWEWGLNYRGETDVFVDLKDVASISSRNGHTVALLESGAVLAWGGYWTGSDRTPPGLTHCIGVAAGGTHNLALRADGTVVAWGSNGQGETNVPNGLSGVIAISAGSVHSVALKKDGTVVAWGGNTYGQRQVPAGLADVVAIAAGDYHTLALKADGTVVAWGQGKTIYSGSGQSMVPAGLNDVVSVAAGVNFSVALKADGTLVFWGDNGEGQRWLPPQLHGVEEISGGCWSNQLFFRLRNPAELPGYWGTAREAGLFGVAGLPDAAPPPGGVSNLIRYGFGIGLLDQQVAIMGEGGSSGLPLARFEGGAGTPTWRLEFLRRRFGELFYKPEFNVSLDPTGWQTFSATPQVEAIDADWERVVLEEPVVAPRGFSRVRVGLAD